jgi:hypothetical protein
MDRMFAGVAVTGESAFVPGASRHLNFISSGDKDEAPADFGTPQTDGTPRSFGTRQYFGTPSISATPASSGSKRSASSTRSTGKSPGKKPRNTTVRMKDANMTTFNSNYDYRTQVIEKVWMEKNSVEKEMSMKQHQLELQQKQKDAKEHQQQLIAQSAEQLGVDNMEGDLWTGVLNICKDDDARCNRTDQIIRAQVQKQAPKHSNFRT